jgi:N-acetylglutamate synthase-like GNAT family acetyltransferase
MLPQQPSSPLPLYYQFKPWYSYSLGMIIRKAIASDVDKVFKLIEDKTLSSVDLRDAVTNKQAIFIVAENSREIVGYVMGFISPAKKTDAILSETRISENERNSKISSDLVESFCRHAFRAGAKTIHTGIDNKHVAFYKKNGFEKTENWTGMSRKK